MGGAVVPREGVGRCQLQRLAEISDSALVILVFKAGAAPVGPGQRVVGFLGQVGVVVLQGLGQLAGATLGGGAVQQGREQVGLQGQSLGIVLHGGRIVTQLLLGAGAVVIGVGQFCIGLDGSVEIGQRGLKILFLEAQHAPIIPGRGIIGLGFEGFRIVGFCFD